jgi:hypothetical protein
MVSRELSLPPERNGPLSALNLADDRERGVEQHDHQ